MGCILALCACFHHPEPLLMWFVNTLGSCKAMKSPCLMVPLRFEQLRFCFFMIATLQHPFLLRISQTLTYWLPIEHIHNHAGPAVSPPVFRSWHFNSRKGPEGKETHCWRFSSSSFYFSPPPPFFFLFSISITFSAPFYPAAGLRDVPFAYGPAATGAVTRPSTPHCQLPPYSRLTRTRPGGC